MTTRITKSKGRKQIFDKFYTQPAIAKECLKHLDLDDYDLIIEPSAGNGSFSSLLPVFKTLAFDIKPENENIIEQDWFDYNTADDDRGKKTLVIGNPPFGIQNNLAIKFFNHAAALEVDTIAFILPLTFKKEFIHSRLNLSYHLVLETTLPKESFELDGEKYHVPCVFQIWERRENLREVEKYTLPEGMSYVKRDESPDFCFQRIGGNAGRVTWDPEVISTKAIQSHYFIAIHNDTLKQRLKAVLSDIVWEGRDDTVGPRSIGKNEINKRLRELLANN